MAATPKLLLLQARDAGDSQREAERLVFARRLQVDDTQVEGFNLVEGVPERSMLRSYDAILIGGSGDYYVSNGKFPSQDRVLDALRETVHGPVPIFGSCFGFHLLTQALGGEVIHDPDRMELGTYEVTLTEEGSEDELFSVLPPNFLAQLGRKDRARRLPEGAIHLAGSERCPFQGFRLSGRAVWATQFHPELDAAENRQRYMVYVENYEGYIDQAEREDISNRFRSSPHTAALLTRFLDLVLD